MNETVITFTRNKIKEGLGKLSEEHKLRFNRMYSFKNLDKDVNEVVDEMSEEKLDWALTQVQNSLRKDL